MNITTQENPTINIPQRKLFDVCRELNELAFPISRRDDALFYLRPDMCIRQQDFSAIYDENGRTKTPDILEFIYIPTTDDLLKATHGTVNQLVESNTAGWYVYTSVDPKQDGNLIKGNGATPWFALADAWLQVQRWKTGADLKPGDIIH